ncbi:MAG: GNAT family N-acetyltransferase [Dermatophilaceae bacterium]
MTSPDVAAYPGCVPVLTDGVVTLRALRDDDAPALVAQCTDPESMRFLPLPRPYGMSEAHDYLAGVAADWGRPGGKRSWAITDGTGTFGGTISIREPSARRAELGFALAPHARGQGLMSAAVRLLISHLREAGVEVIRWRARRGNWASLRVAWACGFTRPTVVVGGGLDHDGIPHDEWHAALLAGVEPRAQWELREATTLRGSVVLRPWRDEDQPTAPPDGISRRFNPGVVPGPDDFAEWLLTRRERMAAGTGIYWCVADPDTDAPLGHVQVVGLAPAGTSTTGRLGFWLHPSARGRGVAQAALHRVVEHAFAPASAGGLGVRRLEARVIAGNFASQRALYAVGLRREARLAQAAVTGDGDVCDEFVLARCVTDKADETDETDETDEAVMVTNRLRLRPWRDNDGPAPHDAPDEQARRSVPARALPPHENFAEWVSARRERDLDRDNAEWCLAERHTDRPLGYVCVFGLGPHEGRFQGELGYLLYPSARGHGYVGEVLPVVLDYAFRAIPEGLGLQRLHATTTADNTASQAILLKAGFRLTGTERLAERRADGELTDVTHYELLATDERPAR